MIGKIVAEPCGLGMCWRLLCQFHNVESSSRFNPVLAHLPETSMHSSRKLIVSPRARSGNVKSLKSLETGRMRTAMRLSRKLSSGEGILLSVCVSWLGTRHSRMGWNTHWSSTTRMRSWGIEYTVRWPQGIGGGRSRQVLAFKYLCVTSWCSFTELNTIFRRNFPPVRRYHLSISPQTKRISPGLLVINKGGQYISLLGISARILVVNNQNMQPFYLATSRSRNSNALMRRTAPLRGMASSTSVCGPCWNL